MGSIPMQICTRCAENGDRKLKPLRLFAKARGGGHRTICKPCTRIANRRIKDMENGTAVAFPVLDWSDLTATTGRDQTARNKRISMARNQYDNAKAYFPKADKDEQAMLAAHAVELWQFGTDEACDDPWSDIEQVTRIGFGISA